MRGGEVGASGHEGGGGGTAGGGGDGDGADCGVEEVEEKYGVDSKKVTSAETRYLR